MATNFPNSVDSLTNPTTSDTLASVSHSAQHTDVNDAVEAIETALLDGAPLKIDDANNRVGIGTTSPAQKLHVAGSSPRIRVTADENTNAELELQETNGVTWSMYNNNSNGSLTYYSSATGNVADLSSSGSLSVLGDINSQSSLSIGGDAIGEWTTFNALIGQGFNMTYSYASGIQPQYTRVGDMIHYIGVVYNFQGTAATGYPLFVQLPVASAGINSGFGVGAWYDQSTPDQYMLQTMVVNANYLHFRNTGAPKYFGETGTGSSMLLAQWDSLSWSITYKAA